MKSIKRLQSHIQLFPRNKSFISKCDESSGQSTNKKSPRKVGGVIESILRCKWSLTVLDLIAQDTNRPGEIVRSLDGLTTKVLNDCLRTNVKFGVLEKQSFPEVPPRVEYQLTDHGRKLVDIIDQIQDLEDEMVER